MSNVRVSNGSPSLERMDARQAEYPKPSACRNLFGPVNHEELTRDLEKHCRDMEEASQRKWNFDFQNHKPLEGNYEWQEVEKGNLPEFYYRPPRPPKDKKIHPWRTLGEKADKSIVPIGLLGFKVLRTGGLVPDYRTGLSELDT
uniref:Cyclin-dependent kinase inhibitor 1B n=1 Tax=Tursiops truncatus TaxID=9739 RepID=A0A6J3S8C9_TURTR|nr:cyclin-dependent kinase inhibitor 1B [Tursiops truncatus]